MGRIFNGTSQAMQSSATFSPGSKFTIAFWLWFDSYSNTDTFIVEASSNYTTGNAFRLSPADSVTGKWGFGVHSSNGFTYGGFTRPTAAAWHHFMLTAELKNASALVAYVDGASSSITYALGPQNDSGISFDANFLYFFARNNSSSWAAGRMAELAIWPSTLLSAADAASLALGYAPSLVRPDALGFYPPLLTGGSPEIELIHNKNLTLTGSPSTTPHPAVLYPAPLLLGGKGAAASSVTFRKTFSGIGTRGGSRQLIGV